MRDMAEETANELVQREKHRREMVANQVADMVRRAVLRELEFSDPKNQLRVVVFKPILSEPWAEAFSPNNQKCTINTCSAVVINPPDAEKPVIIQSRFLDDSITVEDAEHERAKYAEHLRWKGVFQMMELLAQKVYGLK